MPGKRNLAKERAAHAASAHQRQQRTYDLLITQLPQHERALIGRYRILAFLTGLGVRQRNGDPLKWNMLRRWKRDLAFPMVRGLWSPRAKSPAVSTTYAVTAWLLSRSSSDERGLFRIHNPVGDEAEGKALQEFASERTLGPNGSQTAV